MEELITMNNFEIFFYFLCFAIIASAASHARKGGDVQHMGRDLLPSKGGTSKLVVPPNVRRYAGAG